MNGDDEATRALTRIVAILQVAHRDAIEEVRVELRNEGTSKAILESADDWISTGALQKAAKKKGASSDRTVLRRLSELVDTGALERREIGNNVEYRTSGLF
jgi:hypothetical protein